MTKSRSFILITCADMIARSAYQMGKIPLLPIFAAALGATDAYLGFIVSVSTLTGMFLKPLFGLLSDRSGRRLWLLIGTVFFVGMPFVYAFITTVEQLLVVRVVHGLATAIYGPVTLAYVSEQFKQQRAEKLGWFSMARSAGYVVGPAVAGWLLLSWTPASLFTMIGFLSSLTFIPILLLPEANSTPSKPLPSLRKHILQIVQLGQISPFVWMAGGLEAGQFIALYAVKAFFPVYALTSGVNIAFVGLFFALQEVVHMVLKPLGGRAGDQVGYLATTTVGMAILGSVLPLLTNMQSVSILMLCAIIMGLAQALISSSLIALVSANVDTARLGVSLGLVGTLRNLGKVVGPILAGVLIHWLDFRAAIILISGLTLLSVIVLWVCTPTLPSVRATN